MKIDRRSYPLSDTALRAVRAGKKFPLRRDGKRFRAGDETFSSNVVQRLANRHFLIQLDDRSFITNPEADHVDRS